jgi:hypothetical protein
MVIASDQSIEEMGQGKSQSGFTFEGISSKKIDTNAETFNVETKRD